MKDAYFQILLGGRYIGKGNFMAVIGLIQIVRSGVLLLLCLDQDSLGLVQRLAR